MESILEKEQVKLPEPNKAQKECIYNTKNGKYLVIAGPGTGKTFTVTRKIKNMIENEDVEPEKILCLTFSNTAAREMKTKIGDNYAVNVFTYHEFCLDIMEEFPSQFDLLNFKIITDATKRTLIKECIDELNPVAYNNEKNNPYQYSQDILDGIEEIKKNRVKKEDFFRNIKENPLWEPRLIDIEEQQKEKFTKGRKTEFDKITAKIAKMEELWQFYEIYTKKMSDMNYIDFYDMINMVLDKFEDENSSLLEEIAYKYEYILVDEYQDTNKSQNDIVFNLAKYCPNIFVVGDDDQIIYTFQGANLDTIENFLSQFSDVKVVCLEENNRSTQTILDVSQEIAKLQDEFCRYKASKSGLSKKDKELYESMKVNLRICSNEKFKKLNITKDLKSPATSPVHNKKRPVEYLSFEKEIDERAYIVNRIKDLINSDKCPEKLSEIAILTKTNDELKNYEVYLKANGIPVEITGGKNIFDINSVNAMITYMQFLTNPEYYSDKLLSYLFMQPFHIDARDYKTLCQYKSHHSTLTDNIHSLLERGISEKDLKSRLENLLKFNSNTLTEDIKNLTANKKYTIYGEEKLKDFIATYEYLRNYITKENYANSILEIGNKTGIFRHYLNDGINQVENIKGIQKFLAEAEGYFAVNKNKENSFTQFVEYLTKMMESEIKINLDKEEKPLNAVQLSTYHSSKGREFEYVFMPTLTSQKWESNSSSYADAIPLDYNGMTFEELEEKQEQAKFLDNIKLLYVGMTRAKHTLILSSVVNGDKKGKLSWFITQLQAKFAGKENLLTYPEKPELSNLEVPLSDYDYKKEFEEFIKSRFQKSYSASSLNTYRKCPRQYFYNYILNLTSDSGSMDNLTFGLAVHKAFEYALNYAMDNKKYPTTDEAYEVFAKTIDESTCDYPEKLKQSGKENIFSEGKYYENSFVKFADISTISTRAELKLEYQTEDGILFNGYIDRVDKNPDGTYSIYDYKTGTDSSGISKKGVHSDYYYQIGFYKYMLRKQENITSDIETRFLYPLLEEDVEPTQISDAECEEIAQEYIEIVKSIQNLEFDRPDKCGNAKFCPYKSLCKMNVL